MSLDDLTAKTEVGRRAMLLAQEPEYFRAIHNVFNT